MISDSDKTSYSNPVSLPVGKDGIVNIRLLLPYNDREFVNMAYMTILGRAPEGAAVASYMKASARDSSQNAKIDYLKKIGLSEEAKLKGAVLTGFESINIADLCRYSDIEFIENAYILICMRRADTAGKRHFLSLLRSTDYAPVEIIYTLRHSEEGERCGVNIIGLEEAYSRRMNRKKILCAPVIGRVIRYLHSLLSINRRINKLATENYYYRDRLFDEVNSLNERINKLSETAAASAQKNAELSAQINQINNLLKRLDAEKITKPLTQYEKDMAEQSKAMAALFQELNKRSSSCESSIKELDAYAHQNISNISKALSAYDNMRREYAEDKKTINMLPAEVFSLKARLNSIERSITPETQKQDEAAAPQTVSVSGSNVYSSIDYFDFENHFRGSREHIKNVQKIYIPYFEGKKNVLDLGCGRGEFTELMLENNVGVTGVDMYEPYVEYMKSLGLPAVQGEAISYLSNQEHTDGIFLGQVVEHISVDQIVTICNMAYEKLDDGCCLIMETPNPRSLAIYYSAFYLDPSHQKPIHPYLLKYIAEKAGFSKVDILYTDSSRLPFGIPKLKEGEPDFQKFNEAMQRVSDLLYGSQDYAIIARK